MHNNKYKILVIDAAENNMNIHQSLKNMKDGNSYFDARYLEYSKKYMIF